VIPSSFLQDLVSRVDLVELISRHVTLKKGGANYLGLCPFHGEKSASFTVSPSKQFYHCFGCGAHGDAIRFLVEHLGMGFVDAVRDLSQQVGLRLPESDETPEQRAEAARRREKRSTLASVLEQAARHYRGQLKATPRAIDYLKQRGLTGDIAARFGLGYAPDSWKGLASAFAEYADPLLEESGLVIVHRESDEEQRRYDRFRDRIMFPIRSVQGDVIGFGGRVLDRGEPKYLNSPETPVFSKGRELYGLFEARVDIRSKGYALVVEGYMDVVALAQSGFANAVATLGTACTSDHALKLFRFTDSVVFSFDGDAAGRRAALRAMEAALPLATDTRTLRFLYLPAEHDPDSYVRELGAEAFEKAVAQAIPLSVQLVEAARDGDSLDSAEARAQMLARAKPWVAALPAGLLRGQITERLAQVGQVDVDTLLAAWGTAPAARQDGEADGNGRGLRSGRFARRSGSGSRKPLAPLATPLDRAASLLMRRCDWWLGLSHDDHDLLSRQGAPYSVFFAWLDRILQDSGPMTASSLANAAADDEDRDTLLPLIERWRDYLDWNSNPEDVGELRQIIETLELKAVEAELELMFGTPGLSAEAMQRSRELLQRRAGLKQRASAPRSPT
jgi:DNA primase